ncbi:HNH endonuclease signature motif containing protein [Knoellia koreensis]|uniref:DUF222 domain-containing protein n=1 Tax=Knoellia koreensis TaxID=2730921 RepID=A0A849HE58_9MICO|nr:HNH endonuclease signature motif containing protein [Knoellia sp. DB2414S]NNM44923.1 DUF222 domain-containing protein [Knoellia sp. DB2414S]
MVGTELLEQVTQAVRDLSEAGAAAELGSWSGEDLLDLVEATQRLTNTVAALQTRAIAHVAAHDEHLDQHGQWVLQHRGLGHKSLDAGAMIATRMGISTTAAESRVDDAVHQVTVTPQLVKAMHRGDLDGWRARVVTSELSACPDQAATTVMDLLLAHVADRGGWDETAGPLRTRVRRLVAKVAPQVPAEEAAVAVERRCVVRTPATQGTDHWEAELPVESSLPMWHAIETLAHRLRQTDRTLSVNQARADALAQLVLAQADVTVLLHATIPDTPTNPTDPTNGGGPGTGTPDNGSDPAPKALTSQPQTGRTTVGAPAAAPAAAGDRTPDAPTGAQEQQGRTAVASATEQTGIGGTDRTGGNRADTDGAQASGPGGPSSPDEPVPMRVASLTEIGGLSAQPVLLDLTALGSNARLKTSTPLICDPNTGAVTSGMIPAGLGPPGSRTKNAAAPVRSYAMPTRMQRLVRLRDGHCRFPGCRVAARFCDLDHVVPWPIGATDPANLICLCRRHHRIKQRHGWRAVLLAGGIVQWTDPTGKRTTTNPADHLDRTTLTTEVPAHIGPDILMVAVPRPTNEDNTDPNESPPGRRLVEWSNVPRHFLRPLDPTDDIPTLLELHYERLIELHQPTTDTITFDRRPPEPVYDEPPF